MFKPKKAKAEAEDIDALDTVEPQEVPDKRITGKIDAYFLILVLLLLGVGIVCLYSASFSSGYYYHDGNSGFFVVRQAVFAAVGIVVMLVVSKIPLRFWMRSAPFILLGTTLLLATILVIPWKTINGATRWIGVGDLTFQPSELSKIAIIITFAAMAAVTEPEKMKKFKNGILPYIIIIGVTALLVMLQPHLSATVIITATGIAIICVAGASIKQLLALAGIAVPLGIAAIIWKGSYMLTRLKIWLDPFSEAKGDGWQAVQSQVAVGSGGLWGLGFGQSRQKHLFLPEPENDFIFAVICEELGFFFAVLLVLAFAVFIARGIYIARHVPNRFASLVVYGIITQVALQVIINMWVVTGLAPVTGAALPFFSYGGTSLVILLGEMGIVLGISRTLPYRGGK